MTIKNLLYSPFVLVLFITGCNNAKETISATLNIYTTQIISTPTIALTNTPLPTITLTPTSTLVPTVSGGGEGNIIFTSARKILGENVTNEISKIYLYDIKIKKEIMLNTGNSYSFDEYPSFSPDGKSIVYNSINNAISDLYIIEINGNNQFKLTNTPNQYEYIPKWSPDGKYILFNTYSQNNYEINRYGTEDINIINIDGTGYKKLLSIGKHISATWSIDGKFIIYNSEEGEIMKMDINGKNKQNISSNKTIIGYDQAISPDGNYMAYLLGGDIYLYNFASDENQQLTDINGDIKFLNWSPDGKQLVFTSRGYDTGDGQGEIYVIIIDTKVISRITNNNEKDFAPDWA